MEINAELLAIGQQYRMEHAQIPYIIDRLSDERYLTQVIELYIRLKEV